MIIRSNSILQHLDLLSHTWISIFAKNLELQEHFEMRDLEYVPTITELDCADEPIESLWPLAFLPNLEVLDISNTLVDDLNALHYTNNLKELHASFGRFTNLSPLGSLKNLRVLDISYPVEGISTFKPLEGLPKLEEVFCNYCNVQSLDSFEALPNLKMLGLAFNPLSKSRIDTFKVSNPSCSLMH